MANIESALILLSIARQAEFGDAAVKAYAHLLRDIDPEYVVIVCEEFAKKPRAAFETAMPTVAEIRVAAKRRQYETESTERMKQLESHEWHREKPVSSEQWAQFREKVADEIKRKRMG